MEKKLNDTEINVGMTDEEIVKALECCSSALTGEACEKCPLRGKCVSKSNTIEELALDLIHRLQAENAEQNAEIERLIEEKQNIVEKYNQADEAVDHWCEMYKQTKTKNAELQKQVDELIEELCETRICATVLSEKLKAKEQAVIDTAKEILQGLESMANNGVYQGKLTVPQMRLFFKEQYGVEVE